MAGLQRGLLDEESLWRNEILSGAKLKTESLIQHHY